MKHEFRYGNIITPTEIRSALELESIVGIPHNTPLTPIKEVGPIITKAKPKLRKYFGATYELSIIDFNKGYQYLDVFLHPAISKKPTSYTRNLKLPKAIRENWEKYQKLMTQVVVENIDISQTHHKGYFLSSYQPMREIESWFLNSIPGCDDRLITIIQESKHAHQRAAAVYLLQWQPNTSRTKQLVFHILSLENNFEVIHAALRCLWATMGKEPLTQKELNQALDCLFTPSSMVINKTLAIIDESIALGLITKDALTTKQVQRITSFSKAASPVIHEFSRKIIKKWVKK